MAQSIPGRIQSLRKRVGWNETLGSKAEFVELLHDVISYMPDPVQAVCVKYYVEGAVLNGVENQKKLQGVAIIETFVNKKRSQHEKSACGT